MDGNLSRGRTVPVKLIVRLLVVVLLSAISVAQTPLTADKSTTSSPSLVAADKTGWESLKQSGLYHQARLVLTDGGSHRGELISVTDEALVIHSEGSDQTFARDRVQRVSIRRRGHRGRHALIGLGIGAGVGLAVGAAADARCNSWCFVPDKVAMPVVFGPVGAGIGALIPTGGWREVYRLR